MLLIWSYKFWHFAFLVAKSPTGAFLEGGPVSGTFVRCPVESTTAAEGFRDQNLKSWYIELSIIRVLIKPQTNRSPKVTEPQIAIMSQKFASKSSAAW